MGAANQNPQQSLIRKALTFISPIVTAMLIRYAVKSFVKQLNLSEAGSIVLTASLATSIAVTLKQLRHPAASKAELAKSIAYNLTLEGVPDAIALGTSRTLSYLLNQPISFTMTRNVMGGLYTAHMITTMRFRDYLEGYVFPSLEHAQTQSSHGVPALEVGEQAADLSVAIGDIPLPLSVSIDDRALEEALRTAVQAGTDATVTAVQMQIGSALSTPENAQHIIDAFAPDEALEIGDLLPENTVETFQQQFAAYQAENQNLAPIHTQVILRDRAGNVVANQDIDWETAPIQHRALSAGLDSTLTTVIHRLISGYHRVVNTISDTISYPVGFVRAHPYATCTIATVGAVGVGLYYLHREEAPQQVREENNDEAVDLEPVDPNHPFDLRL